MAIDERELARELSEDAAAELEAAAGNLQRVQRLSDASASSGSSGAALDLYEWAYGLNLIIVSKVGQLAERGGKQ